MPSEFHSGVPAISGTCCPLVTLVRPKVGILGSTGQLNFRSRRMTRRNSRVRLAATALGALLPFGSASAADLPVKAKPIVAATFDWSGVYIGAHAGYGGGMKNWEIQGGSFVARGPLVGGQV